MPANNFSFNLDLIRANELQSFQITITRSVSNLIEYFYFTSTPDFNNFILFSGGQSRVSPIVFDIGETSKLIDFRVPDNISNFPKKEYIFIGNVSIINGDIGVETSASFIVDITNVNPIDTEKLCNVEKLVMDLNHEMEEMSDDFDVEYQNLLDLALSGINDVFEVVGGISGITNDIDEIITGGNCSMTIPSNGDTFIHKGRYLQDSTSLYSRGYYKPTPSEPRAIDNGFITYNKLNTNIFTTNAYDGQESPNSGNDIGLIDIDQIYIYSIPVSGVLQDNTFIIERINKATGNREDLLITQQNRPLLFRFNIGTELSFMTVDNDFIYVSINYYDNASTLNSFTRSSFYKIDKNNGDAIAIINDQPEDSGGLATLKSNYTYIGKDFDKIYFLGSEFKNLHVLNKDTFILNGLSSSVNNNQSNYTFSSSLRFVDAISLSYFIITVVSDTPKPTYSPTGFRILDKMFNSIKQITEEDIIIKNPNILQNFVIISDVVTVDNINVYFFIKTPTSTELVIYNIASDLYIINNNDTIAGAPQFTGIPLFINYEIENKVISPLYILDDTNSIYVFLVLSDISSREYKICKFPKLIADPVRNIDLIMADRGNNPNPLGLIPVDLGDVLDTDVLETIDTVNFLITNTECYPQVPSNSNNDFLERLHQTSNRLLTFGDISEIEPTSLSQTPLVGRGPIQFLKTSMTHNVNDIDFIDLNRVLTYTVSGNFIYYIDSINEGDNIIIKVVNLITSFEDNIITSEIYQQGAGNIGDLSNAFFNLNAKGGFELFMKDGFLFYSYISFNNVRPYTTVYQFDLLGNKINSWDFSSGVPNTLLNFGGGNDNTFNIGTGFDNAAITSLIQSDGKILIGGDLIRYKGLPANRIIRLNPDGSIDNTFNVGVGFDGTVFTISIQSDGKILVGGNFYTYQGSSANRIIRLNPDGSRDNTFNIDTGFNGTVFTISTQSNGKILIGGFFSTYKDLSANRIIRLNPDGSRDNTFNISTGFNDTGFNDTVFTIVTQSDGKILIGGDFTTYNGLSANRIIRLNSDGIMDNTFISGSGFNGTVFTISTQSNGKILIGGNLTTYNDLSANRIIRLNPDGSRDNTFNIGTGFNGAVNTISIQIDGKIFIGGGFTTYNGLSANRIIKLNSDGSRDNTFNIGTGFNGDVSAISTQSDGKIIIVGFFSTYNETLSIYIIRLNSELLLLYSTETVFLYAGHTNNYIFGQLYSPLLSNTLQQVVAFDSNFNVLATVTGYNDTFSYDSVCLTSNPIKFGIIDGEPRVLSNDDSVFIIGLDRITNAINVYLFESNASNNFFAKHIIINRDGSFINASRNLSVGPETVSSIIYNKIRGGYELKTYDLRPTFIGEQPIDLTTPFTTVTNNTTTKYYGLPIFINKEQTFPSSTATVLVSDADFHYIITKYSFIGLSPSLNLINKYICRFPKLVQEPLKTIFLAQVYGV